MKHTTYRKQHTLKERVSFAGIGVHTGREVTLTFCPAPEGTGIIFKRVDLPDQPLIPATVANVCDTLRNTTIGANGVRVHTVEHVLAALHALEIDNLYIEVSNMEPPIGNGSSDVFVEMIQQAGIQEQQAKRPIFKLNKPLYWSEDVIHLVALPYDGFRISYTLHYPDSRALGSQYFSLDVTPESFCKELAPCRTFSRYAEVAMMMDQGLIKGGSLDNAVVVKDDVVFSKEGLYFPDEMVRHKILDLVGDLSLVGPFHAHIIAIRSGHASNYQLAKQIQQQLEGAL